jgi:hypothetical protein
VTYVAASETKRMLKVYQSGKSFFFDLEPDRSVRLSNEFRRAKSFK